MNAATEQTLPAIGTPMPGGFFMGEIMLNGQRIAVIAAPKQFAMSGDWHPEEIDIPGAQSFNDGMSNTLAMAEAGSETAKQALSLEIDGLKDFYIPSQDEVELCYRNAKPTTDKNSPWNRFGINVSAVPTTYPYTPDLPAQTSIDAFKQGGEQAFDATAHWTSTQHAGDSLCAWSQYFLRGPQLVIRKDAELAVRCVRREFGNLAI